MVTRVRAGDVPGDGAWPFGWGCQVDVVPGDAGAHALVDLGELPIADVFHNEESAFAWALQRLRDEADSESEVIAGFNSSI
jgi:hypothetical protein